VRAVNIGGVTERPDPNAFIDPNILPPQKSKRN